MKKEGLDQILMNGIDKITVLVVDDQENLRSVLNRILKRAGYRVITAENVAAAEEVLDTTSVDIVLSDVKMPGGSGFDLLKRVRASNCNIAVVMMTGYSDTYTIKDALRLGADEYITKPFKNCEVTMVIERACWRLAASKQMSKNS